MLHDEAQGDGCPSPLQVHEENCQSPGGLQAFAEGIDLHLGFLLVATLDGGLWATWMPHPHVVILARYVVGCVMLTRASAPDELSATPEIPVPVPLPRVGEYHPPPDRELGS
jgi:hypothetical protein